MGRSKARGEPLLLVELDVDVAVDEVGDFVIRDYFANHRRWDRGLLDLVELDDRPVQPGKRGREVRRFLGTQVTEFEIVEVEAGRRLTLRDEPSAWNLDRSYEIQPTDTGARVTFTFDMQPRSALFRAVFPVARRFISRQVRHNMDVLADLLETQFAGDVEV